MYGSLAGFYGVRLFVTILIAMHHGPIVWIWWSLLVDYIVRSAIKTWRFRTGKWMTVQV
jgi:Na+-driven multidrug efflux pump